jgi:hypothetical protein
MRLNRLAYLFLAITASSSSALAQSNLRMQMNSAAALTPRASLALVTDSKGESAEKSVLLAIAYSFLLPGLGDLYAGNFGTGRYFMGAEAGLWTTYGGFRLYGEWLKSDAKTLAIQGASANFDGKDDKFEVNLGNFADMTSYNAAKLRNREYDLLYDPKSSFAWQWASDADRLHYKDLRNRGQGALSNSQFILGALVINRIVSAISAARSVSAHNRSVQALGAWRVNARLPGGMLAADGIKLTVSREF